MDKIEVLQFLEELENGSKKIIDENNDYCLNEENKAKLISIFKILDIEDIDSYPFVWRDKIPLRKDLKNIRIIPGAVVRNGCFLGNDVVVMPSFINIGAHVGSFSMIDSYATIGSCAFIGNRCHISSSSVIAGVLEPISAMPVVIENDVFVGAQCVVSEGVRVKHNAILASGVKLTSSTKIIHRDTFEHFDHIPAYSLVVPGSYASAVNPNVFINCAWIVRTVDPHEIKKTSLNHILRHSLANF